MVRPCRFLIPVFVLWSSLLSCSSEPAIIPRPAELKLLGGSVGFGPSVDIGGADDLESAVRVYAADLKKNGYRVTSGAPTQIRLVSTAGLAPEAYSLETAPRQGIPGGSQVTVTAKDSAGFFYALQTLDQLLRTSGPPGTLPALTVSDAPRYPWRGSMVDSARHFIPVEYLKKHLARMAELKMNVFHWHLTDDQGWRFEVPGYPKLTTVGAWRSQSSAVGMEPDVTYNDKHMYGGFYSDADIAGIVALAGSLHIRIVPEVDMPGHMGAALAAYPDLAGTGPNVVTVKEPLAIWGVFNLTLNPAQDRTFRFVDTVITRLTVLFPGAYIHIGGDEVLVNDAWKTDPDCLAVMAREKLKSPVQLVGSFHRKITEILAAHHRIPVGWEDVVDSYVDQGIRPPTVLQYWRNENFLKAGIARGHRFVFSPYNRTYLDMFYKTGEPKLWAGYISLEDTYGLDPGRWGIPDQQVLGVEGELWSEYTYDDTILDNRLWPRILAVAEDGWTGETRKDWGSFSRRVGIFSTHLKEEGINFNRCDGVSWPSP